MTNISDETAEFGAVPVRGKRRLGGPVLNGDRHDESPDPGRDLGGHSSSASVTAVDVSCWFGDHYVLDQVNLEMPRSRVTALIGPSGCGKSTFLRTLNRMHELVKGATMSGEVLLDGQDLYDPTLKLTDARAKIGMVFQKPNPFPSMSIYDNVLSGLKLTGKRADQD